MAMAISEKVAFWFIGSFWIGALTESSRSRRSAYQHMSAWQAAMNKAKERKADIKEAQWRVRGAMAGQLEEYQLEKMATRCCCAR